MGAGGEHMGALHMGVWHRVHLKGGLSGAGVHLEYLKCMAHGCMKRAHECITHGCVAQGARSWK